MKTTRLILTAAALSLLLASCGGVGADPDRPGDSGTADPTPTASSPDPTPTGNRIDHATGPRDLILRVAYEGGFVPADWYLQALPTFSLYDDGTVIVQGPQIDIYPSPALPNLQARRLTDQAIQQILRAARDAGLSGADQTYDGASQFIADAASTVFTIDAEGERHRTSIYAMSETSSGYDVPPKEQEARRALSELLNKLTSLDSWLPEGSVGPEHPYEASAMRVLVTQGRPAIDEELEQRELDWPLAESLASFGRSTGGHASTRCGVVSGDDLDPLLRAAQKANQLTPWRSDGRLFGLAFRPLLPDEAGCEPSA